MGAKNIVKEGSRSICFAYIIIIVAVSSSTEARWVC
jgi:hypothetical protein